MDGASACYFGITRPLRLVMPLIDLILSLLYTVAVGCTGLSPLLAYALLQSTLPRYIIHKVIDLCRLYIKELNRLSYRDATLDSLVQAKFCG